MKKRAIYIKREAVFIDKEKARKRRLQRNSSKALRSHITTLKW
jgi:hypothetical protein